MVTPQQESLIRRPIKELIDEIDPRIFWQIHRGTVANVNAIAGVQHGMGGRRRVKSKQRKETLAMARASVFSSIAGLAAAQEDAAEPRCAIRVEVTGSHIHRSDVETALPVQVITDRRDGGRARPSARRIERAAP